MMGCHSNRVDRSEFALHLISLARFQEVYIVLVLYLGLLMEVEPHRLLTRGLLRSQSL